LVTPGCQISRTMAVFAVVSLDHPDSANLVAAVENSYQGHFFRVAPGHYLVRDEGTTQSVAEKLGVPGGARGRVMVYNLGGYFGYAPNTTWEWLKANMTAAGGPSGG